MIKLLALAAALVLSGAASAQTANNGLSMTVQMTTATNNGAPVSRTAVVTATATDPIGANSITITSNGTSLIACTASPCTATTTWPASSSPHTIGASASLKTDNQVHTVQVQYPN